MTPSEQWSLLELWERARDGRSTEEEQKRLNTLIREDAEARRVLAEAALMDAEFRHADEHFFTSAADESTTRQPIAKAASWRWHALTAAAAAVVAAGAVWLLEASPAPVATLAKARSCKWGNSALPTMEGALLPPGMLELVEGMATLKFKSGAEVILEAPVSLEVLSSMECRVKKGTVVAEVPPQAKGFTIHTPETKVVDWGTRFGVSAGEDGKCLVHVIEGLVEVQREGETTTKELRAGQRVDYGGFLASAVNPDADRDDQPESGRWLPDAIRDLGDGWQAVTTAYGEGRDSWIQSNPTIHVSGRESFLRVKHSSHDTKLDRKAYVAFDLSRFKGRRISEAEFVIHVEPSDLGFASLVPDATFSVYALTDETQDHWDEASLQWSKAPAHDEAEQHRTQPIATQSVKVGQFIMPQGTTRGAFSIKGEALVQALRQDSNGLITFIICRETDETARNGLAHAFSSRENTHNSPPTLRLKVE
jgi:ferric-dicitrate binding protein FerR (iron transport regulator)